MGDSDVMKKPPTDAPAVLRWVGWFAGQFGILGLVVGALLYFQATFQRDAIVELRQIRTVLEERLPKKDHAQAPADREVLGSK